MFETTTKVRQNFDNIMNINFQKTHMFTYIFKLIYPHNTHLLRIIEANSF